MAKCSRSRSASRCPPRHDGDELGPRMLRESGNTLALSLTICRQRTRYMQFVLFSLRHALLAVALLTMIADPALAGAAEKRLVAQREEAAESPAYGQREDVMRFARELAERKELDASWVQDKLAQARFVPSVARLIMPPPAGTAKNWAAYRARFVEPLRIRTGLAFWNAARAVAGEGRADLRRAGVDRRRHHRRGDDLRPADGQLSRHRRAGDAGVRLSDRAQGPQRVLPQRARAAVRAVPQRRARSARAERLVCGRDGHAAVHAEQLEQLRGRLRRRRPRRPAQQPGRRDRQRWRTTSRSSAGCATSQRTFGCCVARGSEATARRCSRPTSCRLSASRSSPSAARS